MTGPTTIGDATIPEGWEIVMRYRQSFAEQIDRVSVEQPRAIRSRAACVSKFLRGDASFESARTRPDVITLASSLLSHVSSTQPSEGQLVAAAREGIGSIYCQPSTLQRFMRLMLYPMIVAAACGAVFLGFAFYVAPEFETMFEEFGIEMPLATLRLFGVTHFLRQWWPGIAIVLALLTLSVLFFAGPMNRLFRRPSGVGIFSTRRRALADLAVHASHLRRMGVSADRALIAASAASGVAVASSKEPDEAGDHSPAAADLPALKSSAASYSLLNYAVQLPQSPAHDAMLAEVADYYRRQITTVSDWWVQWLVVGMQWAMMFFISFIVACIFLPLISIISGLTGGY